MRLLLSSLFSIFVLMQYMYWFGDTGFFATRMLVQDVKAQATMNFKLAERNELMRMEIDRIKHDDSMIESIARKDLGMIKPGETFYLYMGES